MMINSVWDIRSDYSIKPSVPKEGDIYYDVNNNRTYIYDNSKWLEFKIHYKDYNLSRNRMIKIKNLFK